MKLTESHYQQLHQLRTGPVPNGNIRDRSACADLINVGLAKPEYEIESVSLTEEGKQELSEWRVQD